MENSFHLHERNKTVFQQLFNDLKHALRHVSKEDLSKLFLEAAKAASISTINSKRDSIENFVHFSFSTFRRYQNDGALYSVKSDGESLLRLINKLPEKTKKAYNYFLSCPRQKQIEIISVSILTTIIFYLSAGGFDFEGGLPDLDLAIGGIGNHRSILTHSILIGLGVEFLGRFSILILARIKNKLPNPHHSSWDSVYEFIDEHKESAIAAMWLGIGVHLLKDTGIIAGGFKPYSDFPISMPMEAHKSIVTANGIASIIFTTNSK